MKFVSFSPLEIPFPNAHMQRTLYHRVYIQYVLPHSDLYNVDAALDADGCSSFGGLKGRARPKQDPAIERDLSLTLEEVFNGCIKKMKISRKVCSHTRSLLSVMSVLVGCI